MAWEVARAVADLAHALEVRHRTPYDPPRFAFRESAVVAAFQQRAGVPHLLFTRRPDTLRHHAGQISFPGGTRDETDADAQATALRELHEELGVPAENVQVLGALDAIPTPTGFRILPFVARIADEATFAPNPAEVAALLVLRLDAFFGSGMPRVEERELFGQGVSVYFYELEGHVIWGATAHILHGLLAELAVLPSWHLWTKGRTDT